MNFWDKLKKPIMVLAPMANVTDAAFRSIIARYGKPDVMWTEFVSVDGLLSEGKNKLLVDLKYSEAERPIVAQIFGAKPENFEKVARMLVEMGFDGIDINMGCPDKAVVKQKAGAGCIKDPVRAVEIIEATKRGAGNVPVSVKTRLGVNKIEIDTWVPALLKAKPAVLTMHLRTMKEMSKVPAHWELMPVIVQIARDHCEEPKATKQSKPGLDRHVGFQPPRDGLERTLIFGNGDVMSLEEGRAKVAESGCDGIMYGRAIFGNPWLFSGKSAPAISERMRAMLEHTKLFEQEFMTISGEAGSRFAGKNFEVMKKHFKAYVNNFDGARELRTKLMETHNYAEVEKIVLEHYRILQKEAV